MHGLSTLIPFLIAQINQLLWVGLSSCQQDSAFLEALPDRRAAICFAIFVSSDVFLWWNWTILRRQVTTWEDMCTGKCGGCADAVKEKDTICRRYQKDASTRLRQSTSSLRDQDTVGRARLLPRAWTCRFHDCGRSFARRAPHTCLESFRFLRIGHGMYRGPSSGCPRVLQEYLFAETRRVEDPAAAKGDWTGPLVCFRHRAYSMCHNKKILMFANRAIMDNLSRGHEGRRSELGPLVRIWSDIDHQCNVPSLTLTICYTGHPDCYAIN